LHLSTFITHIVGRTPLDERSAHHRDLSLHNTKHSQQTDSHASSGIRTNDTSKRVTSDRAATGTCKTFIGTSNFVIKVFYLPTDAQ